MANEKVVVEFQGKDQLTPTLNTMGASLKGFSTAIKSVAAIFLVGEFAQAMKFVISESAESERVFKNLENTLKNVSGTSKDTAKQVDALSKSLSAMSGFTDEDLNSAFTRLVQITQDVGLSTQALKIAMDFARGSGQDLMSASESLGRALEGNTRGLRQYGIMIKEGASETEILSEVQKRFAGSSAVYMDSLSGQWELFKKNIADVAETLGNELTPMLNNFMKTTNEMFTGINLHTRLRLASKEQDAFNEKQKVAYEYAVRASEQLSDDNVKGEARNYLMKELANALDIIEGKTELVIQKTVVATEGWSGYAAAGVAAGEAMGRAMEEAAIKAEKSMSDAQNTIAAISPFLIGLGHAIGATAAGATDAWKQFAVSALSSVIDFAENAIKAEMAVMLAAGNIPGVVLGAAGLVGLEAIKAGVQTSASASTSTSTDTTSAASTTSSGGTVSTGAPTVSAPSSTNLSINLFNPVFMDKESKIQMINDMLNLASANGWNVSRTPAIAMAP